MMLGPTVFAGLVWGAIGIVLLAFLYEIYALGLQQG